LAKLQKSTGPEGQIRQVLLSQVDAWNRGDLEGYMNGYWRSPELTFYSGGTVTKGWEPTLERYRKRYQGEGKQMGKLAFASLDVELLGQDAAFIRGSWQLTMSDGKQPHGLFTLIMKKMKPGWRIVHDHTSGG
jgi:beta-aspartyl-peptidase (threonine type)